jgi:hypothetical protein
MWPSLIEVQDRGLEETMELFLMQDQEMIQACSSHTAQKAFVIWHLLVASGTAFEGL